MVTAIPLVCLECGARLLVAPGVPLGVCNPCSTAFDLSTGSRRRLPVEEPAIECASGPADAPVIRLPFLRFEASAPAAPAAPRAKPRPPFPWEKGTARPARAAPVEPAPVHVMAFSIERIGSQHDDGARLTFGGPIGPLRPGRLDSAPEIAVPAAAGIARFLALRLLDRDAGRRLTPELIRLGAPSILAVPYAVDAECLIDLRTGTRLSGIRPAALDAIRPDEAPEGAR